MIKIIAIDLDDTLLNEDLEIPEVNKQAIKEAEDQDVHVVLASGRTPHAMKQYAQELDMHGREGYLIANNGSTIMRTHDWEVVREHHFAPELANRAWSIVKAAGFPMQYYRDGKIYSAVATNEYSMVDSKLSRQEVIKLPNFDEAIRQPQTKFVIPGEPKALSVLENTLKAEFGTQANIFISKPYFLEILPAQADKGSALEWTAAQLGISREECLAMGDSMNDYGMLGYAGHSAAMSNGHPEILAIAEYVTKVDHNQGAVAEAIRHFMALG